MLGLGLDFEATSINPEEARPIELGFMLMQMDGYVPVEMHDWIISQPAELLTPEIQNVTHILPEHLRYGYDESTIFNLFNSYLERCDCVIAYNGRDYDRTLYFSTCKRLNIQPVDKVWVDPLLDIEWPAEKRGRKLVHAAAEHGFLNPFAHRAVFDVMTMMKIVEHYDFNQLYRNATIPWIQVKAIVSFQDKDKAKELGFHWNSDKKIWWKAVREDKYSQLQLDARSAGFEVSLIR